MGGGARYPYPKEVWSPSGGWWSRPANWKANTAMAMAGIGLVSYMTWMYSAQRERRDRPPEKWLPSMMWSKEFQGPEYDHLRNGTKKEA